MSLTSQLNGKDRRFSFDAVNEKEIKAAFEVVRFEGEEAISRLYRFELLLVSRNSDIDESKVVGHEATFALSDGVAGKEATAYMGLVQEFAHLYQVSGWTFYKAVLVPKLWKLEAFFRSEVYLDKTKEKLLAAIIDVEGGGFTKFDFDIKLREANQPTLPYVCQYQESHFNFISRWAERLGIYWWYETKGESGGIQHECAVFSDTYTAHPQQKKPEPLELQYRPELAPDPTAGNFLQSFILEIKSVPKSVTLMGYNYEKVEDDQADKDKMIHGEAVIDAHGIGDIVHYEGHLNNKAQAELLAKLRAEAIRCQAKQYRGETIATGLRCGYRVKVTGHYRASFNRGYMLTRIRHSGSQTGLLLAGLHIPVLADDGPVVDFYRADFTAIPDDVQFRSEIKHPWPKIEGTVKAFIDAGADENDYARVDGEGRYKVQVPFKMGKKDPLKGSAWIRRAAIYAGEKSGERYGIYFPLHKGTEVLLSFVRGNPDQPVILMAMPNSRHQPLVTDANNTQSIIKTAGGNFIGMEDKKNEKGLLIESPTAKTMIRLGDRGAMSKTLPEAKMSKANGLSAFTEENITLEAEQEIKIKARNKVSIESETSDVTITAKGKVKTTSKSDMVEWCGGSWTTTTTGTSFKLSMAQSNSVSLAATFSVSLAGTASITAGLAASSFIGGRLDNWLVYKHEIGVGWKKEHMLGAKSEVVVGSKDENIIGKKTEVVTGVKSSSVGIKVDKCVTAKNEILGARFEEVKTSVIYAKAVKDKFEIMSREGTLSKEVYDASVENYKARKTEMKTLMSNIKSEVKSAAISVESGNKIFK